MHSISWLIGITSFPGSVHSPRSVVSSICIYKHLGQTCDSKKTRPLLIELATFIILCDGQRTTINGHYQNSEREKKDGSLDLAKIDSIEIIDIVDTH